MTVYNNPIVLQRADPWVLKVDGEYWFTASDPEYDKIAIRHASTINDLQKAPETVVWRKHESGVCSKYIWAPELHRVNGAWYIYFAGASAWQKFRYITLPALRPTFNYVVIFGLIGSFQVFDQVFILTSGGPARSTETIVYRIYTEAFGNGKLGYASALSYVLLIMTLIVGLIQLYTNNKHEKEEIA